MCHLLRLSISLLLISISVLCSVDSIAHNRSQSHSNWIISDHSIEAIFTAKAIEVTRLQTGMNQSLDIIFADHLEKTVSIKNDGQACPLRNDAQPILAKQGYIQAKLVFDCGLKTESPLINITSFFDSASSHVHYAHVITDSQQSQQYLFTEVQTQHQVTNDNKQSGSILSGINQYIYIGIDHIIGGADHILFLFALLLLVRRFKDLIWLITGFTVGHSITLAITTIGWVIPDLHIVEATIGFTIALVAVDNIAALTGYHRHLALFSIISLLAMAATNIILGIGFSSLSMLGLVTLTVAYLLMRSDNESGIGVRPVMAIGFGLIHGFGFASALTEIGIPTDLLWASLLGFNIGIELGQLLIIGGLWLIILGFKGTKYVSHSRLVIDITSASLCGLGLYWFVGRSYGII